MTNEEIYNENGLQITFSSWDWCSYLLRTSIYSVVVCEDYGYEHINWHVSILDRSTPQKKLLEVDTISMPELLKPITGSECRKLKTAEEVNAIVGRLINLKCFL